MNPPASNHVVVWILTALVAFGALSAVVGVVLAIAMNGAGVPLEYLENSCAPQILDPRRTDPVAGPSASCGMILA